MAVTFVPRFVVRVRAVVFVIGMFVIGVIVRMGVLGAILVFVLVHVFLCLVFHGRRRSPGRESLPGFPKAVI
jgi:hypothetical protein